MLLNEIISCEHILDKEVCPAYADLTVKAKRTLSIFENCVSSPGLHKFDEIFDNVIKQLVDVDPSFRKQKEEAAEDW